MCSINVKGVLSRQVRHGLPPGRPARREGSREHRHFLNKEEPHKKKPHKEKPPRPWVLSSELAVKRRRPIASAGSVVMGITTGSSLPQEWQRYVIDTPAVLFRGTLGQRGLTSLGKNGKSFTVRHPEGGT